MARTLLAPSLQVACERWASRPAVTHRARTLTYGELGERIASLATAYRSLGIEPGHRIVCQLPPSPEHIVAVDAAWACGAIHVGAHHDATGPEVADLVERTQASALVFEPPPGIADPLAHLRTVRAAAPSITAIVHGHPPEPGDHALAELLASPAHGLPPAPPAGPDDPALLLLTSGTTGRRKAAVETLPALWAKMQLFADEVSPGQDDVHLMYLPIAHVFGLKLSLMALASGGRLVFAERFLPEAVLRLVGDEAVTVLPGTPTHLTLLLRALRPERHQMGSLRWAVTAAAPIPPAVVEGVYERLGAELLNVYGCSEGFITVTADRDEIRRGSVGRNAFRGPEGSAPDGSVAILHPERDTRLLAETAGEIAFGASRPVRYWGEPSVAIDGWYRSGDLGWLDQDGCLFVSGRLKEVVNRGGLKVPWGEVEMALAGYPGLADCAVIPTPDPILGEAICACVVPVGDGAPGLSDVRAHLAESLGRQKLPDELCVLESIPRSPVGKIDRAALIAHVVAGALPRMRVRHGVTTGAPQT